MTIFILPTRSSIKYRGKYPCNVRSLGTGYVGFRVELMDGRRLWAANYQLHGATVGSDYSEMAARAVPMTEEQHLRLLRLAYISSPNRTEEERKAWEGEASDIRAEALSWGAPAAAPTDEPAQLDMFANLDETIIVDGFELSAALVRDDDQGAPWVENDGHGPVSTWTGRAKRPGELVLNADRGSKRYYDFAAACKIARRDGWGPKAYSLKIERGANGLVTAIAVWFEGREMHCIPSIWHDCENAARAECFESLKEKVGPRRYAAMAARADYEYLRAWCNDEWHYAGVIVTVRKNGIELASASLWGIHSEDDAYQVAIANDLREGAVSDARAMIASLSEVEV